MGKVKKGNIVAFVMSTGRCGTQWLHHIFCNYYEGIETTHEPLHNGYCPRLQLGHRDAEEYLFKAPEAVKQHLKDIKNTLKKRPYFETGHPCWSSVPYFSEIFKSRMKVVVINRHPVSLAKSWMSHGAYEAPFLPHQREKILLSPFDDGASNTFYQEKWNSLSRFEKILFYWLKVTQKGLEVHMSPDVDSILLRYEDLFTVDAQVQLAKFLGLEYNEEVSNELGQRIDRYNYELAIDLDTRALKNHKEVLTLAGRLKYDIL